MQTSKQSICCCELRIVCIHQVAEWCCKIAVFHAHKLGCDDGENGERGGSSHVRRLRGGDLRRLHHAGRRAGECVLAKSTKMIPVMFMGALVYGVRYTLPEYMCTILIAGGVSVFALFKQQKGRQQALKSERTFGLCSLFSESRIGRIYKRHRRCNHKEVSEDECLAYHDGHELVGLNLHVSVHVRVAERRWLGSGEVPARASCCRLGHLTVLSVWCCWAELHRP